MSTKTDQDIAELAARILPAVVAAVNSDDATREFRSPIGDKSFNILHRTEKHIEATGYSPFCIQVSVDNRHMKPFDADTIEDATRIISNIVAKDLIKAADGLITACKGLGIRHSVSITA